MNREGFVAARGCAFKGENVWLLRTRGGIPTVKINGVGANPSRWPDGSFSVQGAAASACTQGKRKQTHRVGHAQGVGRA